MMKVLNFVIQVWSDAPCIAGLSSLKQWASKSVNQEIKILKKTMSTTKKDWVRGLMLVDENIEKHSKLPWECPSIRLSMVRHVIFQFNYSIKLIRRNQNAKCGSRKPLVSHSYFS